MKVPYGTNIDIIPIGYMPLEKGGRTFVLTEDLEVELSDGRWILMPKGFTTDLSSIPKALWSFFTPFDAGLLGDIIHDYLYVEKVKEIAHFEGSVYSARRFADWERYRWRALLAPKEKFKNKVTTRVLRLIGGLFYSRQISIPT